MNADPQVRRLAVLGQPVSHSRSPAMQNAALAGLGLGDDWQYGAIEVAPEDFAELVAGLPAQGYVGVNVTVPHKEAALAVADRAGAAAREIGAANTLTFRDGQVEAENTDAPGLLDALREPPAGRRALLLGAGGAARAVLWALLGAGAEVEVWNRTAARARTLTAELGGTAVETPVAAGYDLIVNSSAAGLDGADSLASLPLERSSFTAGQTVVDMVYGERETALLAAAREAGARTVDGLEILVRQGARSFEIWTGRRPSLELMREAARA